MHTAQYLFRYTEVNSIKINIKQITKISYLFLSVTYKYIFIDFDVGILNVDTYKSIIKRSIISCLYY